jgi:hypothetical protein
MTRNEKIALLNNLYRNKISLNDIRPKARLIIVGVDEEPTRFFLDQREVAAELFWEYCYRHPTSGCSVSIVDDL